MAAYSAVDESGRFALIETSHPRWFKGSEFFPVIPRLSHSDRANCEEGVTKVSNDSL